MNTITVQVPGCTKDNIKITYNAGLLKVVWTPPGQESKTETFFFVNLDTEKTTAKVENGVLTINVAILNTSPVNIPIS